MRLRTRGKRTLARLMVKTLAVPPVAAARAAGTMAASCKKPRCLPYDNFAEALNRAQISKLEAPPGTPAAAVSPSLTIEDIMTASKQ